MIGYLAWAVLAAILAAGAAVPIYRLRRLARRTRTEAPSAPVRAHYDQAPRYHCPPGTGPLWCSLAGGDPLPDDLHRDGRWMT